jgi:hypothetical protein
LSDGFGSCPFVFPVRTLLSLSALEVALIRAHAAARVRLRRTRSRYGILPRNNRIGIPHKGGVNHPSSAFLIGKPMQSLRVLLSALLAVVAAQQAANAQVDLQIGRITGKDTKVFVQVRNNGTQASGISNLSVRIENRADKRVLANRLFIVPPVPGRGTQTLVVDRLAPIGNLVVTAVADSSNRVVETNEANNRVRKGLAVARPAPVRPLDLRLTNVTVHSATQVSVTVRNDGPSNLPRPVDIRLVASHNGRRLFTSFQTLPRLDSGKHNIRLFRLDRVSLPSGATITVSVDSRRQIKETNETNNVRSALFQQ